eukprot:jgi/Chrzof1/4339/Cz14g09100.t1
MLNPCPRCIVTTGGTAQKIGGPFDKEGAIGKQFTTQGAVGGRVQDAAETAQDKGDTMNQTGQEEFTQQQRVNPQ